MTGAKVETRMTIAAPYINCCRNRQQFVLGINCWIFSVLEFVRSQSTFSTDPKVLQNCAGSTLCSSAGLSTRRMLCSNGFDTMHVMCTDLLCVVCIGLLSIEFSTVNTGLGRLIFWKARDLNRLSRK